MACPPTAEDGSVSKDAATVRPSKDQQPLNAPAPVPELGTATCKVVAGSSIGAWRPDGSRWGNLPTWMALAFGRPLVLSGWTQEHITAASGPS